MSCTIKDVAREAGVCIATVSRAFNNPHLVAEEKRKTIYAAAEKLHYSPNVLAKGLVTGSTHAIGVLLPDMDNLFYPSVIKGIDAACVENRYASGISATYNSIEREKQCIRLLESQRVDGFIFVGTRSSDPEASRHIAELAKRIPVVMLYSDLSRLGVCSIGTDDVSGARKAVRYLYDLGHRKIAMFSAESDHMTYRDKEKGYRTEMLELGLPLREDYIFRKDFYITGGLANMEAMLDSFSEEERPTAVFAANDQLALGAIRCCTRRGIRVPEQMKIVGYSGTSTARDMLPEMPTVDQQADHLGRLAVSTLLEMMKGSGPWAKSMVFEPEIVDGKNRK